MSNPTKSSIYFKAPPDGFSVREVDIVKVTGLDRKTLSVMRRTDLKRTVHWEKKGPTVYYSQPVADELIDRFRVDPPLLVEEPPPIPATAETANPPESQAPPAPPAPPDAVELTVVRCNFPNIHVITATTESSDEVRVWVKDAEMFVPGMKIRCNPRANSGDVYDLATRPPRSRGRW